MSYGNLNIIMLLMMQGVRETNARFAYSLKYKWGSSGKRYKWSAFVKYMTTFMDPEIWLWTFKVTHMLGK